MHALQSSRRALVGLVASTIALPALASIARAQSYPARPVRVILGFQAGSSPDIFARLIGRWLSERLGQPFVIENRPGAAGNVGTEAVVRAAPDGYTLLLAGSPNAVNATLYANLSFNFIRDIAPVASIVRGLGVMVVTPSFPANTLPEFIAYAKANPGKINMGSSGIGTPQHLYGELFKARTGVDLVHVPYRGGPQGLAGLLAGEVQVIFDTLSTSIGQIRAGKLRALAVTSAMRSDLLPEVPAAGELVPGYEATSWQGICAPRGTPAEIVATLNREINAGLGDPSLKARVADLGYSVFASSPADFSQFIVSDTEKWGNVIRAANIKPE